MTIRHADLNDLALKLNKPSVEIAEARKALDAWWKQWETLPSAERDRPVSEVLAEDRLSD